MEKKLAGSGKVMLACLTLDTRNEEKYQSSRRYYRTGKFSKLHIKNECSPNKYRWVAMC